jgi:cell division protein ZapA
MSTVTLTIGPKTYTIACADGEEPHIEKLGAMIADHRESGGVVIAALHEPLDAVVDATIAVGAS